MRTARDGACGDARGQWRMGMHLLVVDFPRVTVTRSVALTTRSNSAIILFNTPFALSASTLCLYLRSGKFRFWSASAPR
eukprot:COSAG02_NODE_11883_length_1635_cov_1.653646_2_plen_79_part_00